MTEQEVKKTEEEIPEFQYLEDLGEAGGVAFTSLRHYRYSEDGDVEMLEISITGRGRNAREAFENLGDVINYAKGKGWNPYKKVSSAPAMQKAQAAPSVPSVPAVPAVPAVATGASPAPVPSNEPVLVPLEENVINAVKLVVTPRPEGKVSLAFFSEGHKWADITKVCSIEQAIATLAPIGGFTAQHLQAVATYEPISARISWVESEKLNSAGNPYKNIVSITAG